MCQTWGCELGSSLIDGTVRAEPRMWPEMQIGCTFFPLQCNRQPSPLELGQPCFLCFLLRVHPALMMTGLFLEAGSFHRASHNTMLSRLCCCQLLNVIETSQGTLQAALNKMAVRPLFLLAGLCLPSLSICIAPQASQQAHLHLYTPPLGISPCSYLKTSLPSQSVSPIFQV